MSLRINTNVAALNSYNNLSANQTKLEGAFQQLSSGLRINKAADDAAGLSIAQGLTSQINGLTQAVSNANDGINVAQIADGALGTTQDILQRMRGLVVKAANSGTQDPKSLSAIKDEIVKLNAQLDNISDQTKFGQTNLLDGKFDKVFQVGANGGDTIQLDLASNLKGLGATDGANEIKGVMANALGAVLNAAGSYGAGPTAFGGVTMTLGGGTGVGGTTSDAATVTALNIVNFNESGYTAYDAGGKSITTGAWSVGDGTVNALTAASGQNLITSTGANAVNATGVVDNGDNTWTLYDGANGTGNVVGTVAFADGTYTVTNTNGVSANLRTESGKYGQAEATADLKAIDSAIDNISKARSGIGAVQNQLNYTVTNLQTAITNVTASRSNLTDADLAQQVTSMTQSQILTQAATSVLAQANSAPQAILKLLG